MVPCQSPFPMQSPFLLVLLPCCPRDALNPPITLHTCALSPPLTLGALRLASVLSATSAPYFKEAFVRQASPKEQTIPSIHVSATNGAMCLSAPLLHPSFLTHLPLPPFPLLTCCVSREEGMSCRFSRWEWKSALGSSCPPTLHSMM